MTHQFRIPIGDWSGDGHGHCDWYTIRSNKPVEAWREAYFKSNARWPELAPDGRLSQTELAKWPFARIRELFGHLFDVDKDLVEDLCDTSEGMALYTIAFCRASDSSLTFEMVPALPMLPFWGLDKQRRHIGHIGYELWM